MALADPRPSYSGLPVMIWTAGVDRSCDYLNDRWLEFTGRRLEDELGWGWADRVHPDDREAALAVYRAAFDERRPFDLEYRLQRADGEYRWLRDSGTPRTSATGEFAGYIGCCTDVTERRTLEQRLKLAGGIAHDFNNLLTGILGHVSLLLEDGSLSQEARDDLAQIERAADRAGSLTRRLLAFDRRHAPGRRPEPAASEESGEEDPPISFSGGPTVLLVEDEHQVRDLARRVLERAGYTVLTARDAESAMAAADRFPGHIHLLITDVALPRVSGRELAARLGIHRPAIKVLYVSGTSDGAIDRHRLLEPGTEFLEKPFSLDGLLRKVRLVLGTPERSPRPSREILDRAP